MHMSYAVKRVENSDIWYGNESYAMTMQISFYEITNKIIHGR